MVLLNWTQPSGELIWNVRPRLVPSLRVNLDFSTSRWFARTMQTVPSAYRTAGLCPAKYGGFCQLHASPAIAAFRNVTHQTVACANEADKAAACTEMGISSVA